MNIVQQVSRPKGYENWLVVIFAFLSGVVMLDRTAPAYLFPVIVPDLGLQMWQVGAITSALSISWAVSGWALGSISDYKGRRPILLPAVFILSVLSWLTGVASSFIQMVAARATMGLAEGPVPPVTMAVMAEESTPTRRAFNMGAMSAMGPLLALAVGPILTTQLATSVGWRWSFFIIGIPGIILGLILWKFLKEPGSVLARRMAKAKGEDATLKIKYGDVLKYRNVWVASIFAVLKFNYVFVFGAFGMLYLTNVQKMEMMQAGMAMAGMGLGGSVGIVLLPALSDFVGRKPVIAASSLVAGLSLIAFASVGSDFGLLFTFLFLGGISYGMINLGSGTVPAESVPFHFSATAVAIPITIGEILGSTLMPMVAGGLADVYGLSITMYVAAIGAIAAAFISLLFTETAPRVLERRARVASAGLDTAS